MPTFSVLFLSIIISLMGPGDGLNKTQRAATTQSDSLLITVTMEIDSLDAMIMEINGVINRLKEEWGDTPKDSPWYKDKMSRALAIRDALASELALKRLERAVLVGGD